MTMPVSHAQAIQLAELAAAIRPHGARRWDVPGIVATIERVRTLSLADVAMATLRAAADRTIDTPAPIADTRSSAWRERLTPPTTPPPTHPADACTVCGFSRHRCERQPKVGDDTDHQYQPRAARPGLSLSQETA